jgi:threonine synthase
VARADLWDPQEGDATTVSAYSTVKGLACLNCGTHYPFALMLGGCPVCQSAGRVAILDPTYAADADCVTALSDVAQGRLWDYHPLLPIPNPEAVVSLGEGATPLLALADDAAKLGAAQLWMKYEAINPTHSFKDRTNAVAVAAARYFGCDKVLCTSTGNHGVSLAAYAARAGLRCLVLVEPQVPPIVLKELRFFGAEVVIVTDGNTVPLMASLWHDHGWYVSQRNAPGVGGRRFGNPYGMEGYKTIAYEIFDQLGKTVPDKVLMPVGGGDGAWGIYKGFAELHSLGLAQRVPQIIACQSAAGAPLESAWREQLPQVAPVDTTKTIAFSIVERQTGDHALLAIRRSGGRAVAVADVALRAAEETLRHLGICVEPSSAASLAGAHALAVSGEILPSDVVVLIATGTGLRWPATFDNVGPRPPAIAGNLAALQQVVDL